MGPYPVASNAAQAPIRRGLIYEVIDCTAVETIRTPHGLVHGTSSQSVSYPNTKEQQNRGGGDPEVVTHLLALLSHDLLIDSHGICM